MITFMAKKNHVYSPPKNDKI